MSRSEQRVGRCRHDVPVDRGRKRGPRRGGDRGRGVAGRSGVVGCVAGPVGNDAAAAAAAAPDDKSLAIFGAVLVLVEIRRFKIFLFAIPDVDAK